MNSSPRPARSLAPREHGAYGQLALPLLAALASARPGLAAFALAAGAGLAFAAHEPLLVVLGARGPKARREVGARAGRLLVLELTGALGCAVLGLARASADVWRAAGVACVLAVIVGALVARSLEKTAPGEVLAGTALASASVPVALSAGLSLRAAWSSLAVWAIAFAAATFAVRGAIAHFKRPRPAFARVAPVLVVTTLLGAAALTRLLSPLFLAAPLPIMGLALWLSLRPPHPSQLRAIGWRLVAATVATGVGVVVASRALP